MARIKKVHGEAFKAKVTLESVRGDLTAKQIGSLFPGWSVSSREPSLIVVADGNGSGDFICPAG